LALIRGYKKAGQTQSQSGNVQLTFFHRRAREKKQPSHSDAARVKISGKIKNKTSAELNHFVFAPKLYSPQV
jgi:hypothetical protein